MIEKMEDVQEFVVVGQDSTSDKESKKFWPKVRQMLKQTSAVRVERKDFVGTWLPDLRYR